MMHNADCNCHGTLDACKECSGHECCGIVNDGGIIDPPFLTKNDIQQIEKATRLDKEIFAHGKENPATGNVVYSMKTVEGGGCFFFNKKNAVCEIYACRPVDCRLFPLDCRNFSSDIKKRSYHWALYKFPKCNLSKKDISTLLEYKDKALQIIGNEIHDFATCPLNEMEIVGFEKLQKIDGIDEE